VDSPSDNFAVRFIRREGCAIFVKVAGSNLAGSQGERRIGKAVVGSSWDFVDSELDAFVSFVSTS